MQSTSAVIESKAGQRKTMKFCFKAGKTSTDTENAENLSSVTSNNSQ